MTTPDGWSEGRLGNACTIEIGGTPSRNVAEYWDVDKETENAWVSIKDMQPRVILETAEHISDLGIKHSNAKLQPTGTVLLSFKLTIGRVAFAGRPLYTNEAIAGLRPREMDPDYLYYGLQHWDLLQGVDQAIKGATLNKAKLKKITFEYPTRPTEQAKIAEVLSTVDRAIEQTEALIAKQQRIKTGLMQDLLTRGIDSRGNLRSEETHEFKDSPLGRIPVEWQMRTLNDCVSGSAPICYGILMPGRGHDGGVPVIKVKDVIGGRVVQDDILLTDPRIDNQYRRSRLKAGDVLLTIRGTTGRVAIVPPELDGANITQDTARVRLKDGLSNQFFYFLLQSFRLQNQIQLHTLGQAVKGINIAEVKRLFFGLPDEREQARIASRLSAVQQAIDRSELERSKQRSLKTGLMQDLLTGKVRVTPLLEKAREAVTA